MAIGMCAALSDGANSLVAGNMQHNGAVLSTRIVDPMRGTQRAAPVATPWLTDRHGSLSQTALSSTLLHHELCL
eukprot:1407036-Amphidinium_carterae.1